MQGKCQSALQEFTRATLSISGFGSMAMRFLIPCLSLAACLLAGGCATPPFPERPVLPEDGRNPAALRRASQTLAQLFPQRYSAMQRALITAGGKQFTCDGWLTASPAEGHHSPSSAVLAPSRICASGPMAGPNCSKSRHSFAPTGVSGSSPATCAGCSFRRRSLHLPAGWPMAGWCGAPPRMPPGPPANTFFPPTEPAGRNWICRRAGKHFIARWPDTI